MQTTDSQPKPVNFHSLIDSWRELAHAARGKDSLYYDGYREALNDCADKLEKAINKQ